jgi:hypothetical protein
MMAGVRRLSGLVLVPLLLLAAPAPALFTWPWETGEPWPTSSEEPVTARPQPLIGTQFGDPADGAPASYSFVVFGDQRALADGEWQEMLRHIGSMGAEDPGLLFVIDTGDIVNDGRHADQFAMLREILAPIERWPYWVAVGNHEVHNNEPHARANTAAFLADTAPGFSADRMYYRKDVGPVRFLFLDTNDLVYGEAESDTPARSVGAGPRATAQLDWLIGELPPDAASVAATTVVVMHHPLIQSSRKHRPQARVLWSLRHRGRTLPDILLDGGVDLILTGHTHTYERFRLQRADGRRTHLINLSGRPRTSFLWFGDDPRRASEIQGRELESLSEWGWRDLVGWRISQEEAMRDDEADQFARFDVDPEGRITLRVFYLDDDDPQGFRRDPPVPLD